MQEKKWYREWLAWRIPGLRVLDFQRIRDKVRPTFKHSDARAGSYRGELHLQERQTAKQLFLTADGLPTQLSTTLSTTVTSHAAKQALNTDEPRPVVTPGKAGRLMSKEEADKVKEAIAKATSVEEIRRLERSLKEGFMPSMEAVGA